MRAQRLKREIVGSKPKPCGGRKRCVPELPPALGSSQRLERYNAPRSGSEILVDGPYSPVMSAPQRTAAAFSSSCARAVARATSPSGHGHNVRPFNLLQPDGPFAARHAPGTRLVLGAPPHGDKYSIAGPPFGHEMVIAVASASPLFTEPLAEPQTEREFLTAYRRSLIHRPDPTRPPRRAAAAVLLLETSER